MAYFSGIIPGSVIGGTSTIKDANGVRIVKNNPTRRSSNTRIPLNVFQMGFLVQYIPGNTMPDHSPGSGVFAQGKGASWSTVAPPLGEIWRKPDWFTVGTYVGSHAFGIKLPTEEGLIQGTSIVWWDNRGAPQLDDAYGVGKWVVRMCCSFDICVLVIQFTSGGSWVVEAFGPGYLSKIAQGIHGLFPTEALIRTGSFDIALSVPGKFEPKTDEWRLYHKLRTLSTITPADNTLLAKWSYYGQPNPPKGITSVITATPYPFHHLTSFIIEGTVNEGPIVKTVPILDPYGTTEFKWDLDDHTIAEWLLDRETGQLLSDVYVTAVSVYDGTKPLPAGSPISIQCNTNECCAPAWEILSTDAPASWNLAIDSNGLITGFIPRANPLGVYYIEVQVTGPTQSTSARVYVEVTAALLYGNTWVGKAKLDTNITGLVENGLYVYACTYEKKIYRALTSDLTTWSEVAYVGVAAGPFGAIAKLNDNLLCAMELHASGQSKLWTSTDGATWTRGTTNYSGQDLGQGQLFKVNTAVVLWTQAFPGFASNKPVAQLIDATSGLIVETAWNTSIFQNRVPNAVFNAATGRFIYQTAYTGQDGKQFGESGITDGDIPINPIPLENTIVGANGSMENPITLRDGEYTWAPASNMAGIYLRTSTDGTTWTITTTDLASTYRLYPISVLAPILTQIRLDNATGHLYRTTDRWATVNTAVLTDALGSTASSPMPMIEIEASGVLVFGCSAAVSNIYTSEA